MSLSYHIHISHIDMNLHTYQLKCLLQDDIRPIIVEPHTSHLECCLHLLGRIGECVEVANGAVFLASDEASFITGHGLVIDGGVSVRGAH